MRTSRARPVVLASAAVALFAPSSFGAGTLRLYLTPRAASITPGGTMLIDVNADFSGVTSGQSIAGWKFDVLGHANGTLAGDVNNAVFANGVNDGLSTGSSLLDFAGGQLPKNLGGGNTSTFLGTLAFTDSLVATDYTVTLSITDYVATTGALNVYINGAGSQSRSVPTPPPIGGGGHEVVQISTSFTVVPVSAGFAQILGGAGLLAIRRRR